MHQKPSTNSRRHEAGTTLLEVALAGAILTFSLMGVASAFGTNANAVGSARGLTKATKFVEEVYDSINATKFGNLMSLNGNVAHSHSDPTRARWRSHISVSQHSPTLMQIRLVLFDHKSGHEVTRMVTYRAKR